MKKLISWGVISVLILAGNAYSAVDDVLTQNYNCSQSIKIRSQSLTSTQQQEACAFLKTKETFFHNVFGTAGDPVANDYNTSLRANVYSSSTDYGNYAGEHFNIPTDNGGMYLEGTPSNPNNQAEFIAYESGGEIWNLKHEYVHYLDGRYNLYGDFCDMLHDDHSAPEYCSEPSPNLPHMVWWTEGVAEYITWTENNSPAAEEAGNHTYSLSQLFNTSYHSNSGQGRIYTWGYLAVRFMMERHRSDVEEMLGYMRSGNFNAYQSLLTNEWGTSFNAEFNEWLDCLNSGSVLCGINPTSDLNEVVVTTENVNLSNGQTKRWNFNVPSNASNLMVSALNVSGDLDLYMKFGSQPTETNYDCAPFKASGEDEACSVKEPKVGTYHVLVDAFDSNISANFKISYYVPSGGSSSGGSSSGGSSSGGSSSGGSSSGGQLQNGVPVSGLSASTGNDLVYSINVPSGASNLVIKIEGGSGDADLYTRAGAVPTDSNYACRPYASGNNETCTEPNPNSGTWYARVKAYSSFSNVTLTASYNGGGSSSGGSSSGGSSSGGSSSGGSSSGGSSSGGNQLQNGVPVSGLSASTGNDVVYSINVPSGASNLVIKISGGSGDADLYTRAGAVPTDSNYACRPYAGGNSETCTEPNPSSGTWYARVKAYESFSGVTLTASYNGGGSSSGGSSSGGSSSGGSSSGGSSSGGGIENACASESPHSGNGVTAGDTICVPNGSSSSSISYFWVYVPSNTSSLLIRTQHGSGNGNLYYKSSTWATSSNADQSSTNSGNTESITVNNPGSGYRYISVVGQRSGMSLRVDLQ